MEELPWLPKPESVVAPRACFRDENVARQLELPGAGRRPLRLTAEPPREFKEGLRWLGLEQPELPGARLEEWRD